MPDYRRWWVEGGTYFFTAVSCDRQPIFGSPAARAMLRAAYNGTLCRYRVDSMALAVLPDHLHAIWSLPDGERDYARCWAALKSEFTRSWPAAGGAEAPVTASQAAHGHRGVWQRNYWAHFIATMDDFERHLDYIHYNPVKHGLAKCPHAWRFSTFRRWVRAGVYASDWGCVCDHRTASPPSFSALPVDRME